MRGESCEALRGSATISVAHDKELSLGDAAGRGAAVSEGGRAETGLSFGRVPCRGRRRSARILAGHRRSPLGRASDTEAVSYSPGDVVWFGPASGCHWVPGAISDTEGIRLLRDGIRRMVVPPSSY